MKMYQILELQRFYNSIKDKKMPLKVAYRLNKLITKANNEIAFYQEKMQAIAQEYGEKDITGQLILTEDGQAVKIREGCEQICEKRISELTNLDIQIDGVTFTLDELDSLDISISDMNCLMPFIEE